MTNGNTVLGNYLRLANIEHSSRYKQTTDHCITDTARLKLEELVCVFSYPAKFFNGWIFL